MDETSSFKKHVVILVTFSLLPAIFLFCHACKSREEKDKIIVSVFVQALEAQNTDEIISLRAKILERGPDIVRSLVEAMHKAPGSIRSDITYIIEKMGDQAIQPLIVILFGDPSEQRKLEVLNLLGVLENPKSVEQLVTFLELNEENEHLRFETAKILVQLNNETGFQVLNEILVGQNRSQKISIAILYSELVDELSFPGLIAALEQESDGELKTYIIETLGKLKNPAAVPFIEKYGLRDTKAYLVRRTSAVAIASITGNRTQYIDEKGQKRYP